MKAMEVVEAAEAHSQEDWDGPDSRAGLVNANAAKPKSNGRVHSHVRQAGRCSYLPQQWQQQTA